MLRTLNFSHFVIRPTFTITTV